MKAHQSQQRWEAHIMQPRQPLLAAIVVCAVVLLTGATGSGVKSEGQPMTFAATQLPIEGTLPSLAGAIEWLNTQPLTMTELRGKVVIVEFWTYTCINWRRTLPYVRAWADKYKDQGLVVIGVHTPEFAFEKDLGNVRHAVKEIGITFPVAVDSDYAIWGAFRNQYWPALYFVDAQGRIRHHHFGEGDYEQSEVVIQRLLAEAGHGGVSRTLVSVTPSGVEVAADWANLKSPETYLGYERSESFASAGGAVLDKHHLYAAPANLDPNEWALAGDWAVGMDSVVPNGANGRLLYRFHARDVNLIISPRAAGSSVRFRVLIDGRPPGAAHGSDVDDQGHGTVTEPRMYQLIRQPGPIADREFEIQFLEPGVAAFDFTFG
jgi:thiol-disulfide isomerase/thioredoxin